MGASPNCRPSITFTRSISMSAASPSAFATNTTPSNQSPPHGSDGYLASAPGMPQLPRPLPQHCHVTKVTIALGHGEDWMTWLCPRFFSPQQVIRNFGCNSMSHRTAAVHPENITRLYRNGGPDRWTIVALRPNYSVGAVN
jgi:hypothetical protein